MLYRLDQKICVDQRQVMERSPLGRFVRFNRKLGSGSYKVVFLGFDNDTGMEVAWNIISFQNLDKPLGQEDRFF